MDFACKKLLIKISESTFKNGIQLRFYPRWSHRRPRRVLSPEEYQELEKQHEREMESLQNAKSTDSEKDIRSNINNLNADILRFNDKNKKIQTSKKHVQQKLEVINQKKSTTDMLETVIDSQGNFIYTKLKDKDWQVGKIMAMVKTRKQKSKEGLALLEGKRIIQEALQAGCLLKYLMFSRKDDVKVLKHLLPKSGAKLFKMPYREIQMWSDLTTSPGIMGIFKIPKVEDYVPPSNSLPLTIVCDNIREPGNLGATLRIAAGVGAEKVILTKGCVDLWETKVIRSGSGAHFKLQIHSKMDWSQIKNNIKEYGNIFIADNNIITENSENIDGNNRNEILKNLLQSVPLIPYYSVNFSNLDRFVLIVGGETEGISEESYKLATERGGVRLNIPLTNNIDSLNTGTALGIIAFEIKRQILLGKYDENTFKETYANKVV